MAKKKIQKKNYKPASVKPVDPKKGIKLRERKFVWIDSLLKPHNVFPVLALIFGTCFLIFTPPFQVPDEIAHMQRTYKLAELGTKQRIEENKSGDYLPESIANVFYKFRYLSWNPEQKVAKNQIIESLKTPLENDKRIFHGIDARGYFYISYLPQIPAILIGKLFKLNTLYILYLGRFFGLLFYIICIYYALKIIPLGKYLLMTIALFPICLAQAASYNADCVTFSVSFLCVALIIKSVFTEENFKLNLEMILIGSILLFIGVLKIVYLPIVFLIFLIPRIIFKNNNYRYYLLSASLILLSTIFTYAWLKYYTTASGALDNNFNPSVKIEYLINNPLKLVELISNTISVNYKFYLQSTIGILGYLDTILPGFIYFIFSILIILLTLFETNNNLKFLNYQRFILFTVSFGVFLLTIVALYLYSREGIGLLAEGVQGRYFIPVVFPFLLSFYGLLPYRLNLSKNRALNLILYLILIVLLLGTVISLINRYFG